MTFLQTLHANRGELIRLKSQLWWYDGRGWDNHPGRVCLILDAHKVVSGLPDAAQAGIEGGGFTVSALLLINESPTWVWVDEKNCELLTSEPV
jgi:hypothetical protein